MILSSRRSLLAIAAVVDIALHARPMPVAAKMLAARHNLPPRHLETVLQALVRQGILKGVRGPRGGYELAQERLAGSLDDRRHDLVDEARLRARRLGFVHGGGQRRPHHVAGGDAPPLARELVAAARPAHPFEDALAHEGL